MEVLKRVFKFSFSSVMGAILDRICSSNPGFTKIVWNKVCNFNFVFFVQLQGYRYVI